MIATDRSARAVYDACADQLVLAGVTTPRDDLRYMWKTIVGDLPFGSEKPLSPGKRKRLQEAVDRRCDGEPVAYVLGRMPFRTLDLQVDSRVLIPRPETEGLVQLVLDRARGGERVLEIGVGSGCISLSLAAEGHFDRIVGVDVSNDALVVANANRRRGGWGNVQFRHGGGTGAIGPGETFDIIVSNPPYLTVAEHAALDGAVRDYEPRIALVSGEDGLDGVRMVCGAALRCLAPGGVVALEVDARRAHGSAELLGEIGLQQVDVINDVFDRPRYVIAR